MCAVAKKWIDVTALRRYACSSGSQVLLKDLTMAAFVAELLSSDDANAAVSGLQIAETLMQKLPDIFRLYFTREVRGR
jgi:hypothetical protein